MAAILYECRLGCLENKVPKETQDYIAALHLMFSSFKTTMYAGAIPKWLRPIIPKPWEEFCLSWDGLFRFSECFITGELHVHVTSQKLYKNENANRCTVVEIGKQNMATRLLLHTECTFVVLNFFSQNSSVIKLSISLVLVEIHKSPTNWHCPPHDSVQ